jgi:dTDP-4-dehydrorhamnose 3,5-epimerase
MRVIETAIPGVLRIEPQIFGDARGFFMEIWQRERYAAHGLPQDFVQDNLAASGRGVLRGLHLQHPHAQGKLVQVIQGEVFDVAVDVRIGSPWFGRWVSAHLSGANRHQFWVPQGFAHGYCVLSDMAVFSYKCSAAYRPEYELSILWNDPRIAIAWPLGGTPLLSTKDQAALSLDQIDPHRLPVYAP